MLIRFVSCNQWLSKSLMTYDHVQCNHWSVFLQHKIKGGCGSVGKAVCPMTEGAVAQILAPAGRLSPMNV